MLAKEFLDFGEKNPIHIINSQGISKGVITDQKTINNLRKAQELKNDFEKSENSFVSKLIPSTLINSGKLFN